MGLEKYWGTSNNPKEALEQASNKTYKASGDLEITFDEVSNQEVFDTNKAYQYKFIGDSQKFEYSLVSGSQTVSLLKNPDIINWQGFLQALSQNIGTGKRYGGKTLNGVAGKTFITSSASSEILRSIVPFIGITGSNSEIEFSITRKSKEIKQIILKGSFSGNNLKGRIEGEIIFEAF